MNITFVGDVHGKMREASIQLNERNNLGTTIQIGDLGMGFSYLKNINKRSYDWNCRKSNFTKIDRSLDLSQFGIDFFIRGNHDNPEEARLNPSYLGDYGYNPDLNIFWVSGADSVDKLTRHKDIDWWADEQISYRQMRDALELYVDSKPRIMVTHDCPISIAQSMFGFSQDKLRFNNTNLGLQAMLEEHQPEWWFFGHYHRTQYKKSGNTTFVCIEELGLVTLDLELGELV